MCLLKKQTLSVKSIKMGDTTIEKVSPYEMIQRMKQVPSSLERYKRQLNRFRKLL